jgi:hypothetical protein
MPHAQPSELPSEPREPELLEWQGGQPGNAAAVGRATDRPKDLLKPKAERNHLHG